MKTLLVFLALVISITQSSAQPVPQTDNDTVWTRYTQNIYRLQFSPNDSTLLTNGDNGIIIFDTQTGTQLKQLSGKGMYNKDGAIIRLSDSNLDVINSSTYENISTIPLSTTGDFILSPDETTLAIVNNSGLYFLDYQTGAIIKSLPYNYDIKGNRLAVIFNFLFSKDGKYLIYTASDEPKGENTKLCFLNMQTYEIDYTYDNGKWFLSINDDGSLLAFCSNANGKAISIMNTQTHDIINSIYGNASWFSGFTFSPDGNYFVISGILDDEYKLIIYRTSDYSILQTFKPGKAFSSIGITKNNRYLAAGILQTLELFNLIITGIKETNDIEIIYPNPTSNLLTVNFILVNPMILNFNLYEISGKLILNLKNQFYNSGYITENLITENIPSGTYFLKIESLLFNKTFKIVINK